MDFDKLDQLIRACPDFATPERRPPTLMEIAGYPSRENVYSNILAFFFDSEEAHGFGNLFVHSLIEICQEKYEDKISTPNTTDSVGREVRTKNGNRIDILIESSNLIICIETKIWSSLHNNLDEYYRHCSRNREELEFLGIVLTPRQISVEHEEFSNITFSQLAHKLRSNLGEYVDLSSGGRYWFLLLDFIEQIEMFAERPAMKPLTDEENNFLDFWMKNSKKMNDIKKGMDDLWHKLIVESGKTEQLKEKVNEKIKKNGKFVFDEPWIYKKNTAVFDLPTDRDIGNCRVYLDVTLEPIEITFKLSKRRGDSPQAIAAEINKLHNFGFQRGEGGNDNHYYITSGSSFEDDIFDKAVENSVKILSVIADMYHKSNSNPV